MEDNKNKVQTPSKNLLASTKGLDFIITGAIALIFFLSPLFFTGFTAQGIGFEKMVVFYFLVLLALVIWVTKGLILGELNLKRTPLDIPILATLAIFGASTLLSISPKDSLIGSYGSSSKGFIALIIFALFYYLIVNNIDAKKIKLFFWSLIASTSIFSIYTLLQINGWHILPFELSKTNAFNTLGSVSSLTTYLIMTLPLLVVAATKIEDIQSTLSKIFQNLLKGLFGIILIISLANLAILNGFVFWPIPIVGIVIVLMFFLAKIIKVNTNNLLIPFGTFLVLIVLLVLGSFSLNKAQLPAEVSLSRDASWDITKSALKENPIFGSGPSTFYYNFSKFKSGNFNASPLWNIRFDSASGSLFELLSTVGILGALSVIILVLISLSISFLSLIKNSNKEVNALILGLFASFISLILSSLLFAQNNSIILISVIISIFGVATAITMYPDKFQTLKLSFRASPKYALALSAIFLCVSAGVVVLFTMGLKMYIADTYAKQAMASENNDTKIELLQKSVLKTPYQDSYYLSLANNYMARANQLALAGKDQVEISRNLSLAIESGKKAIDINPNRASNNESLALIYENASFYTRGALEWSENLYNKVIELDPNNPSAYLRIALVNMARANTEQDEGEKKYYIEEAIKKYDEAITKKGDLAAAYYGKGIANEKLNNIDGAIEDLKQANINSRNNFDYRFELGRLYFNRGVSQPKLNQNASEEIAKNDIDPNASSTGENLSVNPATPTGAIITKNSDLASAEQLFLSILQNNKNHANALYSLAVLYQKTGETDNIKLMVQTLLNVVQDNKTKDAIRAQFEGLY